MIFKFEFIISVAVVRVFQMFLFFQRKLTNAIVGSITIDGLDNDVNLIYIGSFVFR